MRRTIMRGALCLLLVGASSCGADEPAATQDAEWVRYDNARYGYSVRFPSGLHRAIEPVSPALTSPREILTVGSLPLHYRATNCEAWAGAAQQDLGPSDVFVTVREIGMGSSDDGAPRPAHFARSAQFERSDCPGSNALVQNFRFNDAGRSFDVLIAAGPRATERTRDDVYGILDSLELDPHVKPDWRAVG